MWHTITPCGGRSYGVVVFGFTGGAGWGTLVRGFHMIDSLLASLLDYSALGIFAAYLIWQSVQSNKKQDKMLDDFREELEELRDRREQELNDLRDRYSGVIDDISSHRDQLMDGIDRKQKGIFARLDRIQATVEGTAVAVEEERTEAKIRRAAREQNKR